MNKKRSTPISWIRFAKFLMTPLMSLAITSPAAAGLVFKYHLEPAKNLKDTCKDDSGNLISSKLVLAIEPTGKTGDKIAKVAGSEVLLLKIKAKLCTTVANFQKVNMNIHIPSALLQEDLLLSMKVGQQIFFDGIPQANNPEQKNQLVLTRLPLKGTLAPFKLEAIAGANQKSPFNPILLSLETDRVLHEKLLTETRNLIPWARVFYSHRVNLDGIFTEVEDE